jgi:hypothetical protein
MVETSLQVIDAFIDGERIDANALKAALAEPAGRDYFVDVWLMRDAVQYESAGAPPVAVAAAAAPAAMPRREPRRWLVAAAIAGALLGGYAIGYRTTGSATPPSSPAQSPAVTVSVPPASAFPVPPATRVIQLEFHPATTAGGD